MFDDSLFNLIGSGVPGFKALPSAAIISIQPSNRTRKAVWFEPGRVFNMTIRETESSKGSKPPVGFTSLFYQDPPQFRIELEEQTSASYQTTFRLTRDAERLSEIATITFCCLPFPGFLDDLHRAEKDRQKDSSDWKIVRRALSVELQIGDISTRLNLNWGPKDRQIPSRLLGSLFPFNYARSCVNDVLCSIELSEASVGTGAYQKLKRGENAIIRFSVPTQWKNYVNDFYIQRDISVSKKMNICGNVLAICNLDLVRWPDDKSFAQFTLDNELMPLGVAALGQFDSSDDLISIGNRVVFSIGSDSTGKPQLYHRLLSSTVEKSEMTDTHMVHLWMTKGESLNGSTLEYSSEPRTGPQSIIYEELREAETIVPCFGAKDLDYVDTKNNHLFVPFASFIPQASSTLSKGALRSEIKRYLSFLGRGDHEVSQPVLLPTIIEGNRVLTTVIYVEKNLRGAVISEWVLELLSTHINDQLPPGVWVEVRSR